jgi:hypothetical protein
MMRDGMSRRGFVLGGLAVGAGVGSGVVTASTLAESAREARGGAGTFVTAGPTTGAGSLKAHAAKCGC